jgi:hypothetical protein
MSPIERSGGGGGSSSGGLTLLFDQELSVAAASIDTGVNGIAQTSKHLYFEFYGRCSTASTGGVSAVVQFNGDTGANYDDAFMRNSAGVVTAASDQAQTSAFFAQIPANSNTAGFFGSGHGNVMSYSKVTAGFKTGNTMTGFARDTTGVQQVTIQLSWRSTAAINQMKVFMLDGSNLIAGSRLTIYGTP